MRWAAALAVAVLVLGPAAAQPTPGDDAHAPIDIRREADLNAANGVRSGTGTEADPYIISDYRIMRPLSLFDPPPAIHISGTHSHVVLRDLGAADFPLGLDIKGASNITVERLDLQRVGRAISIRDSHDVQLAQVALGDTGPDDFASGVWISESRRIVARDVTLERGSGDGVTVAGSQFVWLEGLRVTDHKLGVQVHGSTDVALLGLQVRDNSKDGLWVVDSDARISGSTASGQGGRGIVLGQSAVTLQDVRAEGNAGDGVRVFDGRVQVLGGRFVDNGGAGLLAASPELRLERVEAHGNDGVGLHIFRPADGIAFVRLTDLQVHDNRAGLLLQDLDGAHIQRVRADTNRGTGMDVRASQNITVMDSTFVANDGHGLLFVEVRAGQVARSDASRNEGHGMSLRSSQGLTLSQNTATGNRDSGFVLDGPGFTVQGNTAEGNGGFGFEILPAAEGVVLAGNTVSENGFGNVIERGDERASAPVALLPVLLVLFSRASSRASR